LPEPLNINQHPNKQIKNYTLVSLLPAHYVRAVGEIFHFPKPHRMQFFSNECPQHPISKGRIRKGIRLKKTAQIEVLSEW